MTTYRFKLRYILCPPMLYIDYYYFGGNVLMQCILLGIWFGFVDMNKEKHK